MPQIILKQPGQPVADFAFTGTRIGIAGVWIDCAERQLDAAVAVEIRNNATGPSESGNGAYLAQISIPARRYIEVEVSTTAGDRERDAVKHIKQPLPLDPNAVQVTLWPTA
ncbi:hypothetical protein [Janthinobacterium sp.]|uniref:hypothetical protein n=1 Tax=Janthinobacterium sp. TaxID=1871054 RepID=UPI00261EA566|nr:hypothetical protein [Janthinobacterium sp.]